MALIEQFSFYFKNLLALFSFSFNLLIIIIGYLIYRSDKKNLINILFSFYAYLTGIWGFLDFFVFIVNSPEVFLWILRSILLIAAIMNFLIYIISQIYYYNFLKRKYTLTLISLILGLFYISISLTPLTIQSVKKFNLTERDIEPGIGLALWGLFSLIFNILAFLNFLRVYERSKGEEKIKTGLILGGLFTTIFLVITFNFILPNIFKITQFIPLGSIYMSFFIFSFAYGIIKWRLFNTRIIGAAIFTTIIILINMVPLIRDTFLESILFRLTIGILFLIFGLFLINSVYNEVEQKIQLAELNKKLEEVNKIKSEFLSFASHQVKAPMAVIKGYADLIANVLEDVPQQAKDFARKIHKAVDELLVLIEEFMDYRRIEEGKIEFNFEKLDAVNLAREVYENFKPLAQEKNLQYIFETQFDSLLIKADKIRFTQVIQNLIDNAIKYTKEGMVKVQLFKEDNNLIICVSDTGMGLSKELQEKLFQQFIRDPFIKKEIRGTGLGLYIAKYIVEAHQGKIWAESEGEGRGSRFYIKIPLIL